MSPVVIGGLRSQREASGVMGCCSGETERAGTLAGPRYVDQSTKQGKRPEMTTAVAPSSPLTALDRCDRCGAQAYLRVELAGGGELLFCAHHGRKYGEALRDAGAEIVDETDRLRDIPATAPESER